jgi:hypothetical protein
VFPGDNIKRNTSSFSWNLLRLRLQIQQYNINSSIEKTKRNNTAEKKGEIKKGGGEKINERIQSLVEYGIEIDEHIFKS